MKSTEYSKEVIGVTEWEHNEIENIHDQQFKQVSCTKCNEIIAHFYPGGNIEKVVISKLCSIPDPIPLSPPDLAEYMMRRCDPEKYRVALEKIFHNCDSWIMYCKIIQATPEQRIAAAVKAWERKL